MSDIVTHKGSGVDDDIENAKSRQKSISQFHLDLSINGKSK